MTAPDLFALAALSGTLSFAVAWLVLSAKRGHKRHAAADPHCITDHAAREVKP